MVDLGSGAGIDVFLAANIVKDAGKVIGVDLTGKMLERARHNAEKHNYHVFIDRKNIFRLSMQCKKFIVDH